MAMVMAVGSDVAGADASVFVEPGGGAVRGSRGGSGRVAKNGPFLRRVPSDTPLALAIEADWRRPNSCWDRKRWRRWEG